MPKTVRENATEIRNFLRKENNFITILLILTLGFNIYNHISTNKKLQQIHSEFSHVSENFVLVKKKIDHRYFNTKTSLEQIHHVRIDTYDGQLK